MEKNKADYTNTFCYLMKLRLIKYLYKIKILLIGLRMEKRISINDNSKENLRTYERN